MEKLLFYKDLPAAPDVVLVLSGKALLLDIKKFVDLAGYRKLLFRVND